MFLNLMTNYIFQKKLEKHNVFLITIHILDKVVYKCFVLKFNDKVIECNFMEKLLEFVMK